MILLKLTKRFQKSHLRYIKNGKKNAIAVEKALRLFILNSSHPSLNVEKLANADIWSMRISRSDRIFFTWVDSTIAVLIDIGTHDTYRKV